MRRCVGSWRAMPQQPVGSHRVAKPKLENLAQLPFRRLAVQARKAKNLFGRDAVDVPPGAEIELAKSFEFVRVPGEEGQHARLDRAEIPNDEATPRRRD